MRTKTELFEIIGALTKNEKRYFRLNTSSGIENKTYLKLFNEIEQQAASGKPYNEKLIKEKFGNEKFVKQLTFTKKYLKDRVFKSLRSYSAESNIDLILQDMISRTKILFNKALYQQFITSASETEKTAVKYERFWAIIQLAEMEKAVIIKRIKPTIDEYRILEMEKETIKKISNLSDYNKIVLELTTIYREKGKTRDKSFLSFLDNIKNIEIMRSEDMALTLRAKEQYFFILQLFEDFIGNAEGWFFYANKRYELIKQNPLPFMGHGFNYMHDALVYMLSLSFNLGRHENLDKYFKELKEHSTDSETDRLTVFSIESSIKLTMAIKNSIKDNRKLIIEIEAGLEKYSGRLDNNYELLIFSSLVKINIYNKNFERALKYINKILNYPDVSVREDIQWYIRILNLIVHYELKNYELLEYLLISTYRYLYKRNKMYKLEYLFMGFIRSLPKVEDNKKLVSNLISLKNRINELKNDPFEKNALTFFHFTGWLEDKISEIEN